MIGEAVIANKAWIGATVFAALFAAERLRAAAPAACWFCLEPATCGRWWRALW